MAISNVGATSTTTTNQSATGLAANFETFMTLLTAQLKAQDPLSPLDTKDFTNQLVQFTGVEQQLKTNELLTTLSQSLSLNAGTLAVSYLGKSATASTNLAGIEDGKASWQYEMPQNATSVSLKIYDKNNILVRTLDGEKSQGSKTLNWDGTNSNGSKLTSGEFSLVIDAKNSKGETINVPITQTGTISYVDMSGTEPKVKINGANIALSAITKVGLQ